MAFELAPALFGLAGTLTGGGVTLAANWLTARNQRKIADSTRIQAVADRQYAALLDLLQHADRFIQETEELLRVTARGETVDTEAAKVRYAQLLVALVESSSAAQLAAPADLDTSIGALRYASQRLAWSAKRNDEQTHHDASSPAANDLDHLIDEIIVARGNYLDQVRRIVAG
ncbi:hypothetical protein ACFXHA_29140 [Nocardia sp. NPDC059240]|uniref:hypothetical protein n=1 Tax=Nocardia sp. NPDC059240 TaxID=3346786 RepID=UPI0036C576A5